MDCNDANTICVIPTNEFDATIAMGWQLVLGTLILAVLIGSALFMYFSSRADWMSEQNRRIEIKQRMTMTKPSKGNGTEV